MLDTEIIADQISRAFRGESWHGPSVREVPPVAESSADAWRDQHTLDRLKQQLQSAVRAFPAERRSQELGSEYSAYTHSCGTPQPDLCHAGQIVLLKKALSSSRAWPNKRLPST